MYDELVDQLREPCQYENCVLCKQAADAIEELSRQNQKWEEIADIWREAYAGLERRVYPKPPKEEEK